MCELLFVQFGACLTWDNAFEILDYSHILSSFSEHPSPAREHMQPAFRGTPSATEEERNRPYMLTVSLTQYVPVHFSFGHDQGRSNCTSPCNEVKPSCSAQQETNRIDRSISDYSNPFVQFSKSVLSLEAETFLCQHFPSLLGNSAWLVNQHHYYSIPEDIQWFTFICQRFLSCCPSKSWEMIYKDAEELAQMLHSLSTFALHSMADCSGRVWCTGRAGGSVGASPALRAPTWGKPWPCCWQTCLASVFQRGHFCLPLTGEEDCPVSVISCFCWIPNGVMRRKNLSIVEQLAASFYGFTYFSFPLPCLPPS